MLGLACLPQVPSGVAFKFSAKPAGLFVFHNTIIGEQIAGDPSANMHYRNNLILGENSSPAIFSVNTNTNYSSSDYNGFRPNPGAAVSFQWNSPPASVRADYNDPQRRAALETRGFASLAEYSRATGQDQHSLLVDYDVFMNVPPLDAQDVESVQKVYKAEDFDFRLRPESVAVDRGVVLPNVNEDFSGKAPDLGALETGRPAPHYGPR